MNTICKWLVMSSNPIRVYIWFTYFCALNITQHMCAPKQVTYIVCNCTQWNMQSARMFVCFIWSISETSLYPCAFQTINFARSCVIMAAVLANNNCEVTKYSMKTPWHSKPIQYIFGDNITVFTYPKLYISAWL